MRYTTMDGWKLPNTTEPRDSCTLEYKQYFLLVNFAFRHFQCEILPFRIHTYTHTHTDTLTSNLLHIPFNGYIYVYSQQPHFAIFSEFINVYKRIAVIRCVRWWYMVSIWLCWILWIKIFRCAMLFLPLLLSFSLVANNFRIDFACIHLNKCFFFVIVRYPSIMISA